MFVYMIAIVVQVRIAHTFYVSLSQHQHVSIRDLAKQVPPEVHKRLYKPVSDWLEMLPMNYPTVYVRVFRIGHKCKISG